MGVIDLVIVAIVTPIIKIAFPSMQWNFAIMSPLAVLAVDHLIRGYLPLIKRK